MKPDDFYLRVARALSGCQLVEQALKLYISEALELVRRSIGGKLPFSMSGNDYQDKPLGRLIDTFSKLNDNAALIADLRKFKSERDFLSHKGIAHCLDPDGELDIISMDRFEQRLSSIEPAAQALRIAIYEEGNKFRGELFFGK